MGDNARADALVTVRDVAGKPRKVTGPQFHGVVERTRAQDAFNDIHMVQGPRSMRTDFLACLRGPFETDNQVAYVP
ncbi:hypothetical protein A3N95_20890 [Mycobacteroides abscessus]|nr:hypothetical protein A3N95_20890 [Mycobacteroides abscessus]AMU57601.1 hypothetical protein A3O02_22315 [Mycobacteroides abscessus]